METTKNVLPKNMSHFYNELSEYLDTKILFYGSIQREDYFPGHSDVDVDIFTDNEHSVVNKMSHFLHIPKNKFKKIVWRVKENFIITGYKVKYIDEDDNFRTEFSIYNTKFKDYVLKAHMSKTVVPYYATLMLLIIKYLYYQIPLLDKSTFIYLKGLILSRGLGIPPEDFIVLENDN